LLNGIDAWFHSIELDHNRYPRTFHKLILDQTAMGWWQIFQGRMCREWARLQNQHLHQQNAANNSTSGLLWTTSIITTVWKEYFAMWEVRNDAVHGSDSETRQIARRRKLKVELHHLHNKRNLVLHTDRDLFLAANPEDLDTHIERTNVNHLENWLRMWKPVILESAKTAAALSIQSVRPIRTYFARLQPVKLTHHPPKPRYDKRFHTRHDRNRVRKKTLPPPSNHSILSFFSRLQKQTQHLHV
jgi:hypothetical protein